MIESLIDIDKFIHTKGAKIMPKLAKAVFLFLFIPLLLLLASCGSGSIPATVQEATSHPTPTIAPTPTPLPHHHVGEQVTIGTDWQITINSAKPYSNASGQYDKPGNGEYLIIDVSLKNISGEQQQITSSAGDFVLRDDQGNQYLETDLIGLVNPPSGKVLPGQQLHGTMSYDVKPKTTYILTFTPEAAVGATPTPTTDQTIAAVWDIQS
jgi:hypothetical protein